jgi:hypothetical protein
LHVHCKLRFQVKHFSRAFEKLVEANKVSTIFTKLPPTKKKQKLNLVKSI